MSQLEISQHSPTTFCFVFPVMVAGSSLNAAAITNFNGATSKIVGCVRVSSANPATNGQPYATIATGVGLAAYPVINLRSSNAGDVSVYAIYWTNQVANSNNQVILGC
jgi:hypothetical protein